MLVELFIPMIRNATMYVMKQRIQLGLVILLILIGISAFAVTYYSRRQESTTSRNESLEDNKVVGYISTVSRVYGDEKPLIISADKDLTEGDSKTMYQVTVKGKFNKDDRKADTMRFSVLADGTSAWSLQAYNESDPESVIWQDDVVPIR
jgi:hypothetical protein